MASAMSSAEPSPSKLFVVECMLLVLLLCVVMFSCCLPSNSNSCVGLEYVACIGAAPLVCMQESKDPGSGRNLKALWLYYVSIIIIIIIIIIMFIMIISIVIIVITIIIIIIIAISSIRDKNLYTTTNKCLQCLIKTMYTVF